VKIVLLDEAQDRLEAEDRWWREHRDAKELSAQVLEIARIPVHWRSIAETDTERRYAPICSVVRVLECLEEIDREAWCDEVPN
jgi:hypothetical protein